MQVTGHVLAASAGRLALAGCVAAEAEAVELLAAAPDEPTLDAWLRRREAGEPLAWITGIARFGPIALHIEAGVYVPRAQTRDLAARAASRLPAGGRALDLCTGTGAVAAWLRTEVPDVVVIGVDLDAVAARCARRNGIPTLLGDLGAPLRTAQGGHAFDVVTAVAPYVPTAAIELLPADVRRYEPHRALDGGADGLDLVRRVIATAQHVLRPGGWLVVEVGGEQDEVLAPVWAGHGFAAVEPWWDDDGDLRGVAAQLAHDR